MVRDRDDNAKTGAKGVYPLFWRQGLLAKWELAGDYRHWFNEGAAGNMGVVSEHVYYKLVEEQGSNHRKLPTARIAVNSHEHEAVPEGKSSEGAEIKKGLSHKTR